MALVKYGGGIVQMSGSIAGSVFARNRFGNYARPRTKPVNPNSVRQEAARAIVSYLAEYWHEDLTAVQRGAWDTYAAAVSMKNRLGESIKLTGFNHFIRSNASRLACSLAVLAAAPTVLSLPEKDPELLCSEESITGQTFTFTCDTDGWAANGDPKIAIAIYMGQPQLVSRHYFGGPWRFMDIIDATEGAAGTATLAAPFSIVLDQKVWFQGRVLSTEGRVSEIWNLDPRTIEADV